MPSITRIPLLGRLCALVALLGLAVACAPPRDAGLAGLEGRVVPTWFSSADMNRSLPVHTGIAQNVVDRGGAAWDPQSAALGEPGTTLLFGHRASHGAPFLTVSSLRVGSSISLSGSDGRTYRYSVVGARIGSPTWSSILAFTPPSGRGLTLVACHPVGSTSQRYLVDADLVEVS